MKTLDSDYNVNVAQIVHHGEKLILPEGLSFDGAIDLIQRRKQYMEEDTDLHETFDVFPWDGAAALDHVLREKYGWAQAVATPGFFGSTPPKLINIEVAPGEYIKVPWGRFKLPNVTGYLETHGGMKNGRISFALSASILRKDEPVVQGLFNDIRAYLKDHSIYRGKAIKIRFRDDSGSPLRMPEPKFMRTDDVDRSQLIYSRDIQAAIETNLFTPIERVPDLVANGIPVKRGVLLAGPYGTGKTLAAKVAAKLAVENDLTFVYVSRADELADAVEFAKMYQSTACAVFCEDIDRALEGTRDAATDDILNIIDGIDTKTSNIITVLTTNNLANIHPAMLRPGRLDAVIDVLPPDGEAVERLLRAYGGDTVHDDDDLTAVGVELAGTIPAVVAEVVKRAKLAQLRRQPKGERVTRVTPDALLEAARTIKSQVALLADKVVEVPPTLDQAVHDTVQRAMNGTKERIEYVATEMGYND